MSAGSPLRNGPNEPIDRVNRHRPSPEDHRVLVCLHSLTNPRSNAALDVLCETLNAIEVRYPGTDLQLVYQVPGVA